MPWSKILLRIWRIACVLCICETRKCTCSLYALLPCCCAPDNPQCPLDVTTLPCTGELREQVAEVVRALAFMLVAAKNSLSSLLIQPERSNEVSSRRQRLQALRKQLCSAVRIVRYDPRQDNKATEISCQQHCSFPQFGMQTRLAICLQAFPLHSICISHSFLVK